MTECLSSHHLTQNLATLGPQSRAYTRFSWGMWDVLDSGQREGYKVCKKVLGHIHTCL
jgi:hypothetical protein